MSIFKAVLAVPWAIVVHILALPMSILDFVQLCYAEDVYPWDVKMICGLYDDEE